MTERVFIDTKVLLYARDDRYPAKQGVASRWLSDLTAREMLFLSPQVIGEFCNAALKKAMLPDADIRSSIAYMEPWSFGQVDTELVNAAWKLRGRTRLNGGIA